MGVKDFCLSQLFPDAASGFQLVNKLTVWFIRAQGDQVNCQRAPSERCIALGLDPGSTWIPNFYSLVWMLPIHQPCYSLPIPQPTNQPNLLPDQVYRVIFFNIHPACTDSVKPEFVLKLCFECTGVGEQYQSPSCNVPSPLSTLTDTLIDKKTSVVPNQGESTAGNDKKGHCAPYMPSLG